jgi:threonine dehydrogenase-like Zn-dependent dehydrogenase
VDVLPEDVSLDAGAKVHDLANAAQDFRACALEPGSTVANLAATGAMGTSCKKMAAFCGVSHLILIGRKSDRLKEVFALTSIRCACIGLDTLDNWTSTRALGRKVKEAAALDDVHVIIDYCQEGVDLWQVLDGLRLGGTLVPVGGNWSIIPTPARVISLNC